MQDKALLYKLIISLLCCAGCLVFNAIPAIATMSRRKFDGGLALLWILTRLGLYFGAYVVLGLQVPSDVPFVYYPAGQGILDGLVVYRDFPSPYSPGFAYLVAMILLVWNSYKAIVLASILIDGLGLIVWLKVMRRLWGEPECRRFAIFYTLGALIILDVAIAGQNQSWVALLLGLSVLLYQDGKPMWSAALAGSGIVLVKFLAALHLPAFLRWRSQAPQRLAAALAFPVIVVGAMMAMRIDVLVPVKNQGGLVTSGNIPYLLSGFVHNDHGVFQACSALILLALALYLLTRPAALSAEQIIWALAILTFTCALVNTKFTTNYLVMVFSPICAVAVMDGAGSSYRFGIFNLVGSLELSLWFRWLGGEEHNSALWQVFARLSSASELWKLGIFLPLELALLGFYAYYLARAWKLLQASLERSRTARDPLPMEICP